MKINASTKVAKFACSLLTVIILLLASGQLATAGNLIINGDFETGTFAGWTTTPAATGSDFGVTSLPPAHDTLGAFFSANGADFDSISQTFATTPGAFYTLTFFYEVVADQGALANNEFRVLFNGVSPDTSLFPQSNVNPGFGTFTFTNLQATGSVTTVEFQGRNATLGGFDYLDDVSVTAGCVYGLGYWKNHPDAWPVNSLMLGSETYTKTELLNILGTPIGKGPKADASLILADQLIVAKLNIANGGGDPAPVPSTITHADSLLSGFSGKLPYKVTSSSANGQAMVNDAATLESYNNGALTPACTP